MPTRESSALARSLLPALALAAAAGSLMQWRAAANYAGLIYSRDAVLHGEVWRLLSGPWIHMSWPHWELNLAGLACVLALFQRWCHPLRQVVWLIGIAIGTCLVLLAGFPGVAWMAGLSGPLHGLFAFGALALLRAHDPQPQAAWWRGPQFAWLLLAGLAVKIAWEFIARAQGSDTAPVWLGGPVLIEAHLAGAAAGAIAAILATKWKRARIAA